MAYIPKHNDYFVVSDNYVICVHKKRAIFSSTKQPRPFREEIKIQARMDHASIEETIRLYVAN